MALLLYGHELRQARRATRRQLEEQTKAQKWAALRSSGFGLLGTGSDAGADSGANSGRLQTASQAKVQRRRRHHREDSLLAMLNRPQVCKLKCTLTNTPTFYSHISGNILSSLRLPRCGRSTSGCGCSCTRRSRARRCRPSTASSCSASSTCAPTRRSTARATSGGSWRCWLRWVCSSRASSHL